MGQAGIEQKFSALYHPRGNAVVERVNWMIKGIIQLANKGKNE